MTLISLMNLFGVLHGRFDGRIDEHITNRDFSNIRFAVLYFKAQMLGKE